MMRSREQLFERLKVAEAMRAYISQHPDGVDELCAQLEKVEAELASARTAVSDGAELLCRVEGEREAIWAEAGSLKKEKEALEGQINEAGQENFQLRREMEELRASLAAHKKESEDLWVGMAAQKGEMEASFTAQKKELEEEYQQQADEMYFFGYRCCMKKNGIMHDTPSFPSDEEDKAPGGPSS